MLVAIRDAHVMDMGKAVFGLGDFNLGCICQQLCGKGLPAWAKLFVLCCYLYPLWKLTVTEIPQSDLFSPWLWNGFMSHTPKSNHFIRGHQCIIPSKSEKKFELYHLHKNDFGWWPWKIRSHGPKCNQFLRHPQVSLKLARVLAQLSTQDSWQMDKQHETYASSGGGRHNHN